MTGGSNSVTRMSGLKSPPKVKSTTAPTLACADTFVVHHADSPSVVVSAAKILPGSDCGPRRARIPPVPDAAPRPEPFTSRAAPAALDDLRARLRATRWPDAPQDAGWSLGANLGYLRELVAYWADEFD